MRSYDLILKKRDGRELMPEEIEALIGSYMRDEVADYQMSAFLMAVFFRGMTARETAALTMAMVRSGETLDLEALGGTPVDKHSTGGVGDKTSLVLIPLVAAAGARVVKLSGRGLGHTGGTIDKLEAIPGFRTDLSRERLVDQVRRIGCALAGQTADLVPADKRLYALRDVSGTVESVPLIAASIMSKKIAGGARGIVLDVKAGSGAFMKTVEEARALAKAMVAIGRETRRRTVAVISDMDQPLGRTVGNTVEVAEAIATLQGTGPADLTELCLTLGAHMLLLAGAETTLEAAHARGRRALEDGLALERFRKMVEAQGGDARVVDDPELLPRARHTLAVPSATAGTVSAIDARAIGLAAMTLGAGRLRKEDRIDPAVGIRLERKVGERVAVGEPLATVFANDEERGGEGARQIQAAYVLSPEAAGSAGAAASRPLLHAVMGDAA